MLKQAVDKNNPIPRYLQVQQILEERIRSSHYKPGSRLPGERDLAQELQVSQMTVNKAILALVDGGWLYREHGKGTYVCDDFRPPLPAVLRVGVVVHIHINTDSALADFYLGSLFRGMQQAVANAPVSLSILEASTEAMVERLAEAPLEGFLVVDVLEQNIATVRQLYRAGKRVVVLSASWEEMEAPFVDSDNHAGATAAMQHLLGLGHRRIAGVFAQPTTCNTQHRRRAYLDALRNDGLSLPEEYVVMEDETFPLSEAGSRQVRRLLRHPQRPTAFFCGGYYLALEVMRTIREEGLKIPEDVSVVGFDDPVSAAHLSPPLTTVRQPLDEMGRLAMRNLLHWLTTHEEPPGRLVLPTGLVVRGSTVLWNRG